MSLVLFSMGLGDSTGELLEMVASKEGNYTPVAVEIDLGVA